MTLKKSKTAVLGNVAEKKIQKKVWSFTQPPSDPPSVLVFFGEKIDPPFFVGKCSPTSSKIAVVVKNLNRRVEPLADRSLTRRFISFGAFNYFQKIGACSPEPLTLELATQRLSLEPGFSFSSG